jgi:hypothetical protein
MSYSCVICLTNTYNIHFFSICNKCNNCYVCNNCYKQSDIHKMNVCPICRQILLKTNNNTTYKNIISCLFFLRYFIVYILFIITPSNIIASGLKDNVICSDIFITNYNLFFLITNISNFITIPFIIFSYEHYYIQIMLLFCFMNIIFISLYLTESDNPQTFYTVYNIMYVYTLIYFHLFIIFFVQLYIFYKTKINEFIYEQNLLNLRIYTTNINRYRSRIAIRSF